MMTNEARTEEYQLNQHFVARYNYYMEYVAIQFSRFTRMIFMLAVFGIDVLWQLGVFSEVITVTLMMFCALLSLFLSGSFLWGNNEIAYRVYARNIIAWQSHPHELKSDEENNAIAHYEACYPALYHRFAYLLACQSSGFKTEKADFFISLSRLERGVFRLLF